MAKWENVGKIQGEKGDKGDKGDTGATGQKGVDGINGTDSVVESFSQTVGGVEWNITKLSNGLVICTGNFTPDGILEESGGVNRGSFGQDMPLNFDRTRSHAIVSVRNQAKWGTVSINISNTSRVTVTQFSSTSNAPSLCDLTIIGYEE